MIRINLLKSRGRPERLPLVGRREAILGAGLLAFACVALFYLATQSSETSKGPARAAAEKPVATPVSAPVSAIPLPEPAAATTPIPEVPARKALPAAGCNVTDVSYEVQGEELTVRAKGGAGGTHQSFALENP